ncbi:MAG TPA: PAS domain S-box protein [archaeon]|nr:PAS domain S-box protein [archaeon]
MHEVPSLLHEILKTGHGTFNLTHVNKNGLKIPVEISSHIFELRKEAVTLSIVRDITERKKAEEKLKRSEKKLRDLSQELEQKVEERTKKLKESEEKYRLIFENSPAGISIADLDGYVYTMNKKMSKITGYTIEELNKIGLRNTYVNPEDLKKAVEMLNTEGKVRNFLSKLKDKKGRVFDALFNIDVINFEGKKLLLTNVEDIRELQDLKASLYEKDLLARIFMENISGFVVLLRPSTREIISMNKYAKDMGAIPGLTCYSTIGQSETPCPWCLAPKLWKTGEAQNLVVDALDIAWDAYWIQITDDLYLHYGFDITEQAKREQNLKELNQIKSQLLRRASHELKTPLVSIKGFTDLLLELKTEEFESNTLSVVREIKDGCLRLEHLVNDIIFASKLESSQIKLSISLENLSELIISAVDTLKGFTQARKQKILIDLPEEMFTLLDKDRIQEVLTNLISNAIKYTPKNGTIKLKSKMNKGYFVIMIEDNGIGFTPEETKNIFTQFGKIERYGQGFDVISEGSGLGLYIAKKILTQHKGSIWLESEGRNKGTTFFFSLPIIKE